MKNLRKVMLAILAVILALSPVTIHSDTYMHEKEADLLYAMNLYKGTSEADFDPDLGTALSRETGIVMLYRMFGQSDEAESLSEADANTKLARFTDAGAISDWAKKQVAYAVDKGIVKGYPGSTLSPQGSLVGKAYCSMILRQLGYDDSFEYDEAAAALAAVGGLTAPQAAFFSEKHLIKDDLVGISYGTLSAVDANGTRVIDKLVQGGVVDKNKAIAVGLIASETPADTDAAQTSPSAPAPSNRTNTNNDDDDDSSPVITITGLDGNPIQLRSTDDYMICFSVSPEDSVVNAVYGNSIDFGGALHEEEKGSYWLSFSDFDEGSYNITITATKSGYTPAIIRREVIIEQD